MRPQTRRSGSSFGKSRKAFTKTYFPTVEPLETRALPAVSMSPGASFGISINGADSVIVDCSGGKVRVFDDGVPSISTINCSDVTQLTVIASGNFNNRIQLSGMTAGSFSRLSRISVDAGAGHDSIVGGALSESVRGGAGNDAINGGAGFDLLIESLDTSFTLINSRLTGIGTDTLSGINAALLIAGQSHNTLDASGFSGPVTLVGGPGNDLLKGGLQLDSIFAGDGNDVLIGGLGSDTLDGGAGIDRLQESRDVSFTLSNTRLTGAGTDTLLGINAASLTAGGSFNVLDASAFGGPVTLVGNAGNDLLRGGSSHDSLLAGDGDDILTGNAGNDTINGGAGSDRLVEVRDVTLRLTNSGLTGSGTDLLLGMNTASLAGGASFNTLDATAFSGPVTLVGNGGNDLLWGGTSHDSLAGSDGHDALYGGPGTDTLAGNTGNDGLFGGLGATDRLVGSTGADRFLSAGEEFVADRASEDVLITFRNGAAGNVCSEPFNAGAWTEVEIRNVDMALADMHHRTGNTRLLKTRSGVNLTLDRFGSSRSGSDIAACNRERGLIQFTQLAFSPTAYLRETIFHEVGHHWDDPDENPSLSEFRDLSAWTGVDPQSPGFTQSGDGQWWYANSANFASDYARENPYEDFAETWAAYFMDRRGEEFTGFPGADGIPDKIAYMNRFLNTLASPG